MTFHSTNHYAIVSDADLMEGVASEAASLAGRLQVGKLIYLYDDNQVTLSAGTVIPPATPKRPPSPGALQWNRGIAPWH
jgi:transketolase